MAPEQTGEAHAPARRPPRASIGLAAGAVVLFLMIAVFGAGGGDNSEPAPDRGMVAADASDIEVTTTTLPPLLSDLVPVETDRLSAVSRSDNARTVLWPPFERFARSYRLQIDPVAAVFDATGDAVAFIDARSTLFAGPSPGDAATQIDSMVSSARFHPTETAELAYTAALIGSDAAGLYRVHTTPGLLGGVDPSFVAKVPQHARLLTWGAWGYAIAIDDPEAAAVLVLDPSGRAARVMPGAAFAAGGDAILVDATTATSDDSARIAVLAPTAVDPIRAVGIVDTRFEPIFLFPGADARALNVTIAPDGLRIAVTTFTNTGGTAITIRDRSDETLRSVRIDSVAHPIGFVAGGSMLAMQDAESEELIFVDWRTGANYRIDGLTGDFVAVHL